MDIILIIPKSTKTNLTSNTFCLSKICISWDRVQFQSVPLPSVLNKENLKEQDFTFQNTILCETFLSIGFCVASNYWTTYHRINS